MVWSYHSPRRGIPTRRVKPSGTLRSHAQQGGQYIRQSATTATSRLVSSLLEKKTFNDPELFTDMTLTEIIQEVQEDMEQSLQDERNARTSDREQYLARTNKDEKHVGRLSLFLARGIYWMLWLCCAAMFVLVKGWDVRDYDYTDWKLYTCLVALLFTAWFGLFNHAQIIPSKLRVIGFLDRVIFRQILGRDRGEEALNISCDSHKIKDHETFD